MLRPDKVDNLLGMKLDLNGVWYLRECDISMIKAVQSEIYFFLPRTLMLEMEKLLRLFIPLNVFRPGNFLGQFCGL